MVCQLPRLRRVSGCGLVLLGQFLRPERAPINLNGGRRVLCHSFEPVGIRERGREGEREREREGERGVTTYVIFVSYNRPEGAADIRYAESCMKNGFGLRYLHKFLSIPFLQLQV